LSFNTPKSTRGLDALSASIVATTALNARGRKGQQRCRPPKMELTRCPTKPWRTNAEGWHHPRHPKLDRSQHRSPRSHQNCRPSPPRSGLGASMIFSSAQPKGPATSPPTKVGSGRQPTNPRRRPKMPPDLAIAATVTSHP
jgi:hypothetical protein